MPKRTNYPRLRVHVRKGRNARVYTYFYYDMRPEGQPDIPLGTDREEALAKWEALHHKKPRIKGTLEEAFLKWEQDKLPLYENDDTKRTYRQSLKTLRTYEWGIATWDGVDLPALVEYLNTREAKVQANRELALLSIIWHQAQLWGMTKLPWPAAGMKRAKWKNTEGVREFEVTPEMFAAVYDEAPQFIKDTMDLASATGMRLQDCIALRMPKDGFLQLRARKTGKKADFDVSQSTVLTALVERREAMKDKAGHVMLISTPEGFAVTRQDLRREWDKTRARAAEKARSKGNKTLAKQIESMWLRDMRKLAADLATDLEGASKLLQHSSVNVTRLHYRTKAEKVKPVR